MPPRYTFWTIILDGQPTAFRAATRGELLPTLKQIQATNPAAVMKWFARGRVWESPEEAREAYHAGPRRTPEQRDRGWRPGGEHKDPREKFKKETFQARKRRDRKAADLARRAGDGSPAERGPASPVGRGFPGPSPVEGSPADKHRPPAGRGFKPAWKKPAVEQGFSPVDRRGPKPPWKKPEGDRSFRPEGGRPDRAGGFKPAWKKPGEGRGFKPSGGKPWSGKPDSGRDFKPRGPGGSGFKPRRPGFQGDGRRQGPGGPGFQGDGRRKGPGGPGFSGPSKVEGQPGRKRPSPVGRGFPGPSPVEGTPADKPGSPIADQREAPKPPPAPEAPKPQAAPPAPPPAPFEPGPPAPAHETEQPRLRKKKE